MIPTLIAAVSLASPSQSATLETDFEIGLGAVGLSSRTARFDPSLLAFFRQGEFTTPLYDALHENPWRIPFFAENLRRELALPIGRPHDSLVVGMRNLGVQTRRGLIGNPNATAEADSKREGALSKAIDDLRSKGIVSGPTPNLAAVPDDVQSAAALILITLPKAVEARRLALKEIGDLPGAFARFSIAGSDAMQGSEFDARLSAFRKVDLAYFAAGAFDLFAAAHEAGVRVAAVSPAATFDVRIPTKWGVVALTGGKATKYDEPALLIIDTGGSDQYVNAPTTRSASQPASIVIDSSGNDAYLSDARLADVSLEKWSLRTGTSGAVGPGGALFGYSISVDLQGDDIYRSHRPGIASARFGFAATIDSQGADTYDGYVDSVGFAQFGFALLEDLTGDDKYFGFSQVQGCGQTNGFAVLVDRKGADAYVANDQTIDFPSPQSAQHNVSMAQGAGNGRRADYLDGHSLSGGIGVLYDLEGDDSYSCGVFGQGVGYWMGVGMLFDSAGKDRYAGQWYVQGASAHFAVGYLEDELGDDVYVAAMNMAIGAGHDFGTGAFLDRSGNDAYSAPNLSLGAGNANGIGFFIDLLGNDSYTTSGITLGQAAEAVKGTLRSRALTLGVFMDLGGDDGYPASASWARNAQRVPNVKDRGPTPPESQVGVFWDR